MLKQVLYLVIIAAVAAGCSRKSDPGGDGKVIILMYHIITEGEATDLYERSIADFESDLVYLKNNDIAVIGFVELEEMVRKGTNPHKNMAIITFDDGYQSWLTTAKPILLKHDMKATFFLWVSQIGTESFLTWEEVDLMSHYTNDAGVRPFIFASHTMSHHFLQDMKNTFPLPADYASYLDDELGMSKSLIESVTHTAVNVLALPYGNGAGDEDIIAAAIRNGYRCIRTSAWGAIRPDEADLYNLPSLPMLNSTASEEIGDYLGL